MNRFLFLISVVTVLCSCTKTEDSTNPNNQPLESITHTFTADITSVEGTSLTWQDDDALRIGFENGSRLHYGVFSLIEGVDNTSGSYEGEFFGQEPQEKTPIYAVYPSSVIFKYESNVATISAVQPSSQIYDVNDEDSTIKQYSVMTALAGSYKESLNFDRNHLSFIEFSVEGLESTDLVTSIELNASLLPYSEYSFASQSITAPTQQEMKILIDLQSPSGIDMVANNRFRVALLPQVIPANSYWSFAFNCAGAPAPQTGGVIHSEELVLEGGKLYDNIEVSVSNVTPNIFTLSDFDADFTPHEADVWVVTDPTATTESLTGLRELLSDATRMEGRTVAIEFTNLTGMFPKNGMLGATQLRKVEFKSNITKLIIGSFSGCSSLEEIIIPETCTSYENDSFKNCASLKKINFPNALDWIGGWAFIGCSSLESVNLENSIVWNIGASAFDGCTALKSIKLPKKPKSQNYKINNFAFASCTSLTEISIPSTVTFIADNPFNLCTALEKIDFNWSGAAILSSETLVFPAQFATDSEVAATATITVPTGEKDNYTAKSPWNKYNVVER